MKKTLTVTLEIEPSQKRNGTYSNEQVEGGDGSRKKKSKIEMDGPDGLWAWCVALAACSITFIIAGLARISGILYVAYIDVFDISRNKAAYPYSLRTSTKNLLGPVVGILGQQYGVRAVTLAGGVIASISAAACYFATSIDSIVVLWGGLNGIGCALTVTLIQVIAGQHFKKHKSTASGLSFSGGCVGSFVFPVLIEYLLQNYGLQGTFLILSAIIMHIIPAALILRKPAWLKTPPVSKDSRPSKPDNDSDAINKQPNTDTNVTEDNISTTEDISLDSGIVTEQINSDKEPVVNSDPFYYWYHYDKLLVVETVSNVIYSDSEMKKVADDIPQTEEAVLQPWIIEMVDEIYQTASKVIKNHHVEDFVNRDRNFPLLTETLTYKVKRLFVNKMCNFSDVNLIVNDLQTRRELSENHAREIVNEITEVCKLNQEYDKSVSGSKLLNPDSGQVVIENTETKDRKTVPDLANLKNFVPKKIKLPLIKKDGFREHLKTALRLNYNPFFILVCLCRIVHFVTFVPFVTVLVDYGIDKGLPEDDGKYIIAALSAGDLFGRIGLGWITDRNFLSLPRFMLCGLVTQGILTATLPLVQERYIFMILVSLFGMFVGADFVRHPVLISKYLDRKEQSIAMGCINFVPGLLGFGLPSFIGYFRDNLGSYDKMFFITGSIAIGIGLLWLLEPQLAKFAPPRADDVDDDKGEEAVIPAE